MGAQTLLYHQLFCVISIVRLGCYVKCNSVTLKGVML